MSIVDPFQHKARSAVATSAFQLVSRSCRSGMLTCLVAASLAMALAGCQSAPGLNQEGTRQFQQGQPTLALQSFQQALAADPNNADAYYNMGAVYHAQSVANGDQRLAAQAEDMYNHCLSFDPNHTDGYRGLAALLVKNNRSQDAFTLMKGWVARSPQSADARIELARLYDEYGDRETAKIHLVEAVNKDTGNARAWAALAKVNEDMGNYPQALQDYQRSLALNGFQTGVATRIATLQRGFATGDPAIVGTRTVTAPSAPTNR